MEEENKKTEDREEKKIEETMEKKGEEKKEEKIKPEKKKAIPKKDKAIARGKDLSMSTKQSVAICNFIRNKNIEKAIQDLEQVIEKRRAVPMKGEIPHRKGIGMERGRYPVKASKIFIKLLNSLRANSQVNNMEDVYIFKAKADLASRPYKRFGSRRFKRTNVYLEAKEKNKHLENKEGKEERR